MSTDAAGTTDPKPDDTPKGGTPGTGADDSGQVSVSAQFKKEALENWKPAAEERNRLKEEMAQKDAQITELTRRAYGGGQQATDPRAALVAQLREQAAYDPVAQAALVNMEDTAVARAEMWLANQLLSVPEAKRENTANMIRNAGYQMDASQAQKILTDPETATLAKQLADIRVENERLKNARPNGISPAGAIPANANADEGRNQETIKRAEYTATLQRASRPDATEAEKDRAHALMKAVGTNQTKFDND